MDIISHYSAYTTARTSAASQTGTKTAGIERMSGDEFLKMAREQGVKAPDKSRFLYNGSETRATLSETEIAVLANKYDPHNMDQDTYDAFLDDLQSMGAISEIEKQQMGYKGLQLIAYVDEDGKTVHCGSPSGIYSLPDSMDPTLCMFAPWEADTDLHKWLGERTQKELIDVFEPSTPEAAEAYENLLKGVFGIVGRMQTRREENGTATEGTEVSSVGRSDMLYNGSPTRASLSDTEIAMLANKYDVRNMSDEEYDAFLDDLESMGVISHYEKTRELGYKGIGYVDLKAGDVENGVRVMSVWTAPLGTEGRPLLFERRDANGDIFKWLNDRIQYEPSYYYEDPNQREAQKDCVKLYEALADIVDRMQAQREENGTTVEEAEASRPKLEFMTEKMYQEFVQRQLEQGPSSVDRSDTLYNGSTTRRALSDTEIAVLASKYNVHNMSDAEYDAFLDDLGSMGALSEREKRLLGQHGVVVIGFIQNGKLVPTGASGGWMAPAGGTALFNRQDANGDIFRWINDRIQWRRGYSSDPEQRKNEKAYDETHEFLASVINRMAAKQADNAEKAQKAELVRQLSDKNSEFYTNMRTQLKEQVDKNKEDEEVQAIIDALGAVLDALSGKEDVSGDKASVNKSATDLTKKIGERIARLREKDPNDPEAARLENMLKRLQEIGIYFDLGDMDDLWLDEDENFETLTQYLTRMQAEMSAHPIENEVNQEE